jgi:hypothetical protein
MASARRWWTLLLWLPTVVIAASPFVIGAWVQPRAPAPAMEHGRVCQHAHPQRQSRPFTLVLVRTLELQPGNVGESTRAGITLEPAACTVRPLRV